MHNEMFLNISIISPMSCPSFSPLACVPFGILLILSWPRIESTFLSAWSLKQFGLVCPHMPQWWQKCFTWGPLWLLGNDFPLSFGFAPMVPFATTRVSISSFSTLDSLYFWMIWTSLSSWVCCLSFFHQYSLDWSCHVKIFEKKERCQVSWWKCAPLWHLLE